MQKRTVLSTILAGSLLCTSVSARDAIIIEEDCKSAIINGQKVELTYPSRQMDDKNYIPLRQFLDLLGYNIYWQDGKMLIGEQDEDTLGKMYNEGYINSALNGEVSDDFSDIEVIKAKLRGSVYNAKTDPTEIVSTWKEDGSFEGLEYYNPDRMVWTANVHIQNCLKIATAIYTPENPLYGDADLKAKLAKSLQFWAHGGRVECDNWWYQEIGVPQIVVNLLILNPEEITDDVREVLNAEAARGSIFNETISDRITERPVSNTGANLADKLVTSFKIDIATNNEEELWRGIHLMENELRVFTKIRTDEYGEDSDGIKADYSFHQHVDQIQGGSYGTIMMSDFTSIIGYLQGTRYTVSDEALNQFANWMLDGQQWLFKSDYKELTTAGRSIMRPNALKGIKGAMTKTVDVLLAYPQLERYSELEALKANRLGDTDTFVGNRHFWLSDYMSHFGNDYHVGIKLSSNRTKNGEVINNENLLGYYLSDGVTTLMQEGDEYYNILPLLDWNKLPGTTTPQGELKNLNDWAKWNGEHLWNWKGNRSFVGGVSNGTLGAAVMDYSLDGLDAHKAWFMLDDRMIALGNSISAYSPYSIYTSVNQCKGEGEVKAITTGGATPAKNGDSGKAFLHDGIGYISDKAMALTYEERTDKYEKINLNQSYKDKEETAPIFSLGIDHGIKPYQDTYAYTTLFNADEAKVQAELKATNVQILANDDAMQAVYDKRTGVCEAIVWKAGTLTLPTGLSVNINKKCALIISEVDGILEISASNPDNEAKDLQLVVNRVINPFNGPTYGEMVKKESDTTSRIIFRLNEGIYAGSTTTFNSESGYSEFKN